MPLEKTRCDCCNEPQAVCPECGSRRATPRENIRLPLSSEVIDYGLSDGDFGRDGVEKLDDGGVRVEYEHVCWDCGWTETVEVTVRRP